MPIFKNPIAANLARWLTAATRPRQIMIRPDELMDDIAAGADEIERLTALLKESQAFLFDDSGTPIAPEDLRERVNAAIFGVA